MRRAVQLSEGTSLFVATLGEAYAAGGDWDNAQKVLGQLEETSKLQYVSPYAVARIYAALGKKDDALHLLETAYREHAAQMICLKTDPGLDGLRSDRRFDDILRRMNFPAIA
jgi:predicted Zn-dependent protease